MTAKLTCSLALSLAALTACTGTKDDDWVDPEAVDDTAGETTDDTDETDPQAEAGDSIEEALPVTLSQDTTLIATGVIDPAGDRDFYALEVSQGQFIAVASLSYAMLGEVVLDTVIRLYDDQGELLATNDDMPYRYLETDSALYFQAEYDGVYYVEVLEWADWADQGANGGSSYEYQFHAWEIDNLEIYDNDTQAEADAWLDDDVYIYYSGGWDDYSSNFYGHFSDGDDIDIWPVSFESDGSHYMWSIWPGYHGDAELRMSLYSPDWELLATTDQPEITPDYHAFYDVGVMYPVYEGTYYVVVENLNGSYGPGNFYAGVQLGYIAETADEETEPNDNISQGSRINFTESSATANYYFGRGHGVLPDADDGGDYWTILSPDVGGLSNRYLNVTIQAETVGSTADIQVTVFADDGTQLAQENIHPEIDSTDPEVWDYELPDTGAVHIFVEALSEGPEPLANHYYMLVSVSDEPNH
ncbi:MAG: hypothetical protein H6739_11070 [Alphaproteobacteria bacterium]|nr:hypothetical protein [Alphaproteobacteria bacterium]